MKTREGEEGKGQDPRCSAEQGHNRVLVLPRNRINVLWNEARDWRKHWDKKTFWKVVLFSFIFSLLDTGTDFNFAWSVPRDCPEWHNLTQISDVISGPCGIIKPKNVELLTYFFIAAPGFLLGFSALQQLFADLMPCGKAHPGVIILTNIAAVSVEIALFFGLFVASALFNLWTKEVPSLGNGYEYTLKTIAYLSAVSNLGVKFVGIFCHGPEMKRLVFQATDAETRYEAALQLALVISIYMNSGRSTLAGILSGVTSILVIGKVGVQNYLGRQEKKLTSTSLLGKICLAASVLPAFVFTALFKIGTIAILNAWDKILGSLLLIPLALGPPILVIFVLKIYLPLNQLNVTCINQGVVAELVSLHLWPPIFHSSRIGLAVTIYNLLLFSSFLAWVISHPERSRVGEICAKFGAPEVAGWAEEITLQYQAASILCLLIGWLTLPLTIFQVVGKNKYTNQMIEKFQNNPPTAHNQRSSRGLN